MIWIKVEDVILIHSRIIQVTGGISCRICLSLLPMAVQMSRICLPGFGRISDEMSKVSAHNRVLTLLSNKNHSIGEWFKGRLMPMM